MVDRLTGCGHRPRSPREQHRHRRTDGGSRRIRCSRRSWQRRRPHEKSPHDSHPFRSRRRSGHRSQAVPPQRSARAQRADAAGDGVNVLRAKIKQCSYTGARFEYQLAVGDLGIHAESTVRLEGEEINLLIRPEDCLLYPAAV
ncbi:hypothetical protein ACH40E_00985 [Streptomyces acidicola]|uniref:hypothetical protein n=1 Tax=Streptomyces acidicola TaxID=2596892 RepID=UPI0037A25004